MRVTGHIFEFLTSQFFNAGSIMHIFRQVVLKTSWQQEAGIEEFHPLQCPCSLENRIYLFTSFILKK